MTEIFVLPSLNQNIPNMCSNDVQNNKNGYSERVATNDSPVSFGEALEKCGTGVYNISLTITCSLALMAIGIDLLGFSFVVTAACDLDLTIKQKGVLTSLPFLAILLSSYGWGYVSDTKGRRFTLLLSLRVGFVLACLSAFSPHWICLAVLKFMSVFFSCAINSVTYTLVGESCVTKVRNKNLVSMNCLFLVTQAVASVLAYPTLKSKVSFYIPFLGIVFSPWRLLLIVFALPMGVLSMVMQFFKESPKFLANCGRESDALDVLKYIYSVNHSKTGVEFDVHSIKREEGLEMKKSSLWESLVIQTAPLFRLPLVWRTGQLYYIVFVVYITNNSFLIWVPQIFNVVKTSLAYSDVDVSAYSNICNFITVDDNLDYTHIRSNDFKNSTTGIKDNTNICKETVSQDVMIVLVIFQSILSLLNFCVSYLHEKRKIVLIAILCLSGMSCICINLTPEPISSMIFFIISTGDALAMGILASYFVELYPTSCRGMAGCLSIMVGRTSAFVGINVMAAFMFTDCQATFYFWAILILSSAAMAVFLPADKSVK